MTSKVSFQFICCPLSLLLWCWAPLEIHHRSRDRCLLKQGQVTEVSPQAITIDSHSCCKCFSPSHLLEAIALIVEGKHVLKLVSSTVQLQWLAHLDKEIRCYTSKVHVTSSTMRMNSFEHLPMGKLPSFPLVQPPPAISSSSMTISFPTFPNNIRPPWIPTYPSTNIRGLCDVDDGIGSDRGMVLKQVLHLYMERWIPWNVETLPLEKRHDTLIVLFPGRPVAQPLPAYSSFKLSLNPKLLKLFIRTSLHVFIAVGIYHCHTSLLKGAKGSVYIMDIAVPKSCTPVATINYNLLLVASGVELRWSSRACLIQAVQVSGVGDLSVLGGQG